MATIRWCPIFPKWDIYQPLPKFVHHFTIQRWLNGKKPGGCPSHVRKISKKNPPKMQWNASKSDSIPSFLLFLLSIQSIHCHWIPIFPGKSPDPTETPWPFRTTGSAPYGPPATSKKIMPTSGKISPAVADLASQSESFGLDLQFAIENDPFIDALLWLMMSDLL